MEPERKQLLSWQSNLYKGLKRISAHDPSGALKFLREAMERCPVYERKGLARILYFTGITLRKIGLNDSAVKSWNAAKRLCKTPLYAAYVKRFSNQYGMAKQAHPELDDWRAFYSIQIGKYLKTKKSHSFGTIAEQDMIRDLIFDAWQDLVRSGRLVGKTPGEKLRVFHRYEVIFPYFLISEPVAVPNEFLGQWTKGVNPCPCGSGLPFQMCCGRRRGGWGAVTGKL
ncbi:MAG: hypothetical protein Kow009_13970 [Spirochaetales bacterium]